MKYIIGLSLSTISLAAFLLVMQGRAPETGNPMGKLLINNESTAAPESKGVEATAPVNEGTIKVAAAKAEVAPPAFNERASSKGERIRKVVKELPWDEARSEVKRILSEGGGYERRSFTEERQERRLGRSETRWHDDRGDDDDD